MVQKVLERTVIDLQFDVFIGDDNVACTRDAQASKVTGQLKQVDATFQFLADNVENCDVKCHFVLSDDMVADI